MCVAFWTLEHPEYALILAANRDEFLSRPTIPAAWHNFDSEASADNLNILSGRDVIAGGTWLGINKSGDVAVLTNITELAGKFESSRGELASTFLQRSPSDSFKTEALSTNAPEHLCSYITSVLNNQRKYAGFNLLILSPRHNSDGGIQYEGAMVTNSGGGRDIAARFLTKAESICGGVSNADDSAHAPDQVVSGNDWPKVAQGKGFLQDIVNQDNWEEDELVDALCDMMSVESKIPPTSRYSLRNTISVLPLPVEINSWSKSITPQPLPASKHAAPALQAQITDYYATRLTTIILVRRDGRAVFVERDIWQCQGVVTEPVKADKLSQRRFSFRIES